MVDVDHGKQSIVVLNKRLSYGGGVPWQSLNCVMELCAMVQVDHGKKCIVWMSHGGQVIVEVHHGSHPIV